MGKIFGLAGYAGSGKDTFYEVSKHILQKKGVSVERFAFADALKADLHAFLLDKCKIDIFSCSRADKELVRPILVEYGKIMRVLSGGRHWVDLIDKKVKESKANVMFITDLRHDVYPRDEYSWLKYECGGDLIYISRYSIINGEKVLLKAPNEEELYNNESLKQKCDFNIKWEDKSGDNLIENLSPVVEFALSKFGL